MDAAVDVIIVAKSATPELVQMTQHCLTTLSTSEPKLQLFPIVVETCETAAEYPGVHTVRTAAEPLNYNRYVNVGRSVCYHDFVVCCNNDLVFHPGWLTSHLRVFAAHPEIGCLSSRDPADLKLPRVQTGVIEGYNTNCEVFQWCWVLRREALLQLGPFDEQFQFWGADDAITWQLRQRGVRHMLNADSHVTHLGSRSYGLLPPDQVRHLTVGQGHAIVTAAREAIPPGSILPGSCEGVAGCP